MSTVESELAVLRHPRLAGLATSNCPAWLWSADGSQILWANAVGAAIFGAESSSACAGRQFQVTDVPAAQVLRLAATLPPGGQERLERLRGFGGGYGRALTCACSRIVVADGRRAVLIAATERAGPSLTLAERVRRLFGDCDQAIAGFAPDGALLCASPVAQSLIAGATNLTALDLGTLAADARESGSAVGTAHLDDRTFNVAAVRLGHEGSSIVLVILAPPAEAAPKVVSTSRSPQHGATSEAAANRDRPPGPILPRTVADAAAAFMSLGEVKPAATRPEPLAERRHPLRFVWHVDEDGRFAIASDEFAQLVGPRTARVGGTWNAIAATLTLDPNDQVKRALASRETWSGIVVSWPVDDSDKRLPIELSGLPVFDRDRTFRGYRGFGVCRDVDHINALVRVRREARKDSMSSSELPSPAPAQRDDTTAAPRAAAAEKAGTLEPAKPDEAVAAPDEPPPTEVPALPENLANVVPFRPAASAEPKTSPSLSPVERKAFRDLAQELTTRLRGAHAATSGEGAAQGAVQGAAQELPVAGEAPTPFAETGLELALLDRVPLGVLVCRDATLLYANRHFLEWSGYDSAAAIETAGGLPMLFAEPSAGGSALAETSAQSLAIKSAQGDKLPVEGRMFRVPWNGSAAIALILTNDQFEAAVRHAERALRTAERELGDLKSVLDAASDGVVVLDIEGNIITANARAVGLFAKPVNELAGSPFVGLFATEHEHAIRAHLGAALHGSQTPGNEIDVSGLHRDGHRVPLTLTLTRAGDDSVCALVRDATLRKQAEEEWQNAKRESQSAASGKAEFLAKISHEIRTPLNAMMGLAETIMVERFGPIGTERYREYVKDIHIAGTHLASMINDLLDLSKIETGRMELTFTDISLNDLTQQCVGIMQPQANNARIIIRTALTPGLPHVHADERSLRQIVFNLLSNSIRLTGPGGQIIVSTVFSDAGEAVLRVRDTGVEMTEKDIKAASEPFRDIATSTSAGSGGIGFGLPLTKALAEANHAQFSIKSAPEAGTLIEIAFSSSRIAGG
ncbi:MAG: PAS domain-containing sensor histidine kinase [Xanthobacteraceae bacterium]